ncbi:MAG: hypothetical protein JO208_01675 [Alphaproteobacteria bacterium]|nr:hypothetical protein [Alphaproteobacteria bacterium]
MQLLADDRARVQAAQAAAQARTQARFATMIVPVSDRYEMYALAFAGAAAMAVGGALAFFWQEIGLRLGFLVEAAAFGVTAVAFDWRPLKLTLVPKLMQQARARAMAHREFAAGILAAKDHGEGLLFFASLGERYVEIVASREVHARIGEAAWSRIVSEFSTRAKTDLPGAFVEAIQSCADLLATHFPRAA